MVMYTEYSIRPRWSYIYLFFSFAKLTLSDTDKKDSMPKTVNLYFCVTDFVGYESNIVEWGIQTTEKCITEVGKQVTFKLRKKLFIRHNSGSVPFQSTCASFHLITKCKITSDRDGSRNPGWIGIEANKADTRPTVANVGQGHWWKLNHFFAWIPQ